MFHYLPQYATFSRRRTTVRLNCSVFNCAALTVWRLAIAIDTAGSQTDERNHTWFSTTDSYSVRNNEYINVIYFLQHVPLSIMLPELKHTHRTRCQLPQVLGCHILEHIQTISVQVQCCSTHSKWLMPREKNSTGPSGITLRNYSLQTGQLVASYGFSAMARPRPGN